MTDKMQVTKETSADPVDQLVANYLSENPLLVDALATLQVAQEQYRKSLLALNSFRVVTSGTTNLEA